MIVCGVMGGGCRSEHQIVLRNASLFIIRNVSLLFLLTHQLGGKIMSKNPEAIFALLKSLGTDWKSKMEWPKFVNVIALGLPHENWSFIADLRNLFLDPAPLDTANSSSSRLPGYGECYSQRRSSSYAALCCGAPLREVRCSAASSSSR
jgi:hypothetical protein